jgi:hypothetical protein
VNRESTFGVPGRVKTKSNLVVAPSGGGIFAFFCSERDHKPKNIRVRLYRVDGLVR